MLTSVDPSSASEITENMMHFLRPTLASRLATTRLVSIKSTLLRPRPVACAAARLITTERITPTRENDLLVEQRRARPMSPHLTVYKKQLTFNMSGAHRILGIAMAGTYYCGLIAYVALPLIGYPFSMHDVAALVSALPESVKMGARLVCALPFTFHMLNGFRHLLWDTGSALSIKGVYTTGYIVLALMCFASVGLAMR